jgi:hypothetical protein
MRVERRRRIDDRRASGRAVEAQRLSAPRAERPAEPGRALVPVTHGHPATSAGARPSALFLAQLIAVAQQAPQTRQRRRAEPAEASAAYAASYARAADAGRAVSRSS